MSTTLRLIATPEAWQLKQAPIETCGGESIRVRVARSLLDLTALRRADGLRLPVAVVARTLDSDSGEPASGSLVVAPGAHGQECLVPRAACLPLASPDEAPLALLSGAAASVWSALRRGAFEPGVHAIVLGLDLAGLLLLVACRLAGAVSVGVLDESATARSCAERLGAWRACSPEDPGWPATLVRGTSRSGADVVFVTRAGKGLVQMILPSCRKGARIVLLTGSASDPLDLYQEIHRPGRALIGHDLSHQRHAQWRDDAARLLKLGGRSARFVDTLAGGTIKAGEALTMRESLLSGELPAAVIDWDA